MILEKLNQSYHLKTESGKNIGGFQMDSDGSYYFWINQELTGCWTAQHLREIADKLDEVNKPFYEYLAKNKNKQY